ncbi:MAG: TetM/TetW/TetO/TetS family tetracycline resistance ribosomal protection protein [Lachnospiraceae bacterium]|nr:TetM/TetW/TetO/TetS family tetracycline resistance ribosomal protection protein [Lachnospiraceae bacterium]
MNHVWGILAHVDAGKTTLSESILYTAGQIAKTGRVDHGDAFLDTDSQEKKRGITIFSKPAVFTYQDVQMTLLDTPGHVDFATETERAVWALDYAILLISGTDGVQAHTKTLYRILKKHHVPTIIYINKIDMEAASVDRCMLELKELISDRCVEAMDDEGMATAEEEAMEEYLEKESLSGETKCRLFQERKVFPVFTGSALNNRGTEKLLDFMAEVGKYRETNIGIQTKPSGGGFAGRIYKIERLGVDARLTFTKITGGSLKVKDVLPGGEKINEIRLYSGAKYTQIDSAAAGDVVALVGPQNTFAGQGLGEEAGRPDLSLAPVLSYKLRFLDDTVPKLAYPKLLALNEEDPSLHVTWDEALQQIKMTLMGQVQTEILIERIQSELGYQVAFEEADVLYKETIAAPVEGVGHFEPLRHYAEVHLLIEPLPAGSGVQTAADVSTDELALNWQRLIETHILEKEHVGTAIGVPLTDVKYTIVGGRAHIKHTEGGDFREATYRAIRQGLMEVGTVILEPSYRFEMVLPREYVGRAMMDIEAMSGKFEPPVDEGDKAKIIGTAPAIEIKNYSAKLVTYAKGEGSLSLIFDGYVPCHNPEEVMMKHPYDPELDVKNPAGSVFCAHGGSDLVPWQEVKNRCHVPCLEDKGEEELVPLKVQKMSHDIDEWISPEEVDRILAAATHRNQGKNPKKGWHYGESGRVKRVASDYIYTPPKEGKAKEKYMLVDGYNLIYAWPELKEVLEVNLDGARGKLLDILSNYKAMTDYEVIAVFDAYRVKGHKAEASDYLNIHQVFTAEAQTADAYIEKFTHEQGKKYDITVVTSDGLEQVIIRGTGARLISSREFIEEVERKAKEIKDSFGVLEE